MDLPVAPRARRSVTLSPAVREGTLRGDALEQAVDVAVGAFGEDPFFSYLFDDPARRHVAVARLHRAVLVHLAQIGIVRTAYLDDRVVGVALWVPPGKWPYPMSVQLRQAAGAMRAFLPNLGSLPRAGRILRSVELAHPKRPQWYLQLLMVDPTVQRQGIGGILQASTLELCDAEGLPAWLETQKQDNLAYYARFGFEVAKEHRPVPDGPPMWSLSRDPRG